MVRPAYFAEASSDAKHPVISTTHPMPRRTVPVGATTVAGGGTAKANRSFGRLAPHGIRAARASFGKFAAGARAGAVAALVGALALLAPVGAPAAGPEALAPVERFHVRGGRVWADDVPIALHGLNWAGLDTADRAPHGLWTGRGLATFLDEMRSLGFTAIRLSMTPEVVRPGRPVADWASDRGYGPTGDAMLRQTLAAALDAGLWVVLGFNGYDSVLEGGDVPRPYAADGSYTVEDWIADLGAMAGLARDWPHVVGIDLFNEPYGLSWSEWRDLAGRAGAHVLARNPRLVVLVQGVGEESTDTGGYGAFWGSNLTEAARRPIDRGLIPDEKLVYSPHVYGPDVYRMPYFDDPDFPRNMPAIWDTHFGHLAGPNAVCPGEFGGHYRPGTDDARWQDAFIGYMKERGMTDCWFYWQLAPTSDDTGGILEEDWTTPDERKLALLARLKEASRR